MTEATRHQVVTTTEDRDLQAIEVIQYALFGVLHTDAARRRVLNFTLDALDERQEVKR